MSKRNKAIVVIIFFIGLVFLLFGSPRKIVNGQTCTGGFSCGNWANCCEPASDSSPNCNPGVCDSGMCDSGEGGCTWKTYCDDSFEDNDCTGDSQPACLLSPHCSISACSGPNSVTCNWYIPPPPPPTSTPPPPPPGEDNCYKCEPFCVLYTVPSGTCTTDCNACPGATSTPPPACNTPADPTNLDFNCGWSGTNITITWSDVSDADYFSLRVDNTSANPWDSDCSPINPGDICDDLTKAEANCSGGTCSYTFASDPNANYDWWIHSRVNCSPNVWGNGIHGPLMKCTPNCSITGGGSTITLPGNGLYSAEFESLDGELEGEIFWQRIGFPLTRISYQDFGSATSGSITNASWIPPGVGDYQVCCRAWNDARTECMDSQFSPVPPAYSCVGPDECMNVRVDVLAFCNPPTNLAPTTDRACGTTSVDFSWVETVGCTGYVGTDFELDRDANGVTCGANGDICRNFSAGTTTASSTVGQGYRYRWHMRSRNGAGGGNWGSWVYFDVPPATPSILTTTLDCAADPTLGEGMVAVDWTSATGADTYMLYRCSGASCVPASGSIAYSGDATFYDDYDRRDSTTYGYAARSYDYDTSLGCFSANRFIAVSCPECDYQCAMTTLTSPMRVGDDQTFLAAWVENTGSPLCVDVDTFRYSSSDGSVAAVCEAGSCTTTTWDDHSPAWFSHVTAVGAGGPATITSEALILGAIPVCSDDEQITVFQPSCSLTFTALPVMSVGQILPLQVSAGVPVGGDVNCGSGGSGITVSEVGSSGAITILPPNPACEPSYSVDIRADAPGTAIVEATATMDDGITACSPVPNLAISVTYADWFQVQGSDVGSDGGFVSVIPITAPLRYLIRDGAVSDITLVREHGVLSYANASPPDLGTGTVSDTSTQDWLANSAYAGTTYDYAYFKSKLDENIFDPNINDSDMRAGDWSGGDNYGGFEWFFYNAASLGALEINENIDFGNRKVILFVEDSNLAENGILNINAKINLNNGTGFFMTIVDGTISVNPNNVGVGAGPHLEGLYVSKTFATGTKGPGIADNQLHIRGSVTSSTFSLQRDLLDGNQNNPGEFIESAPDLLFLYPKELGVKKVEWTEVAP